MENIHKSHLSRLADIGHRWDLSDEHHSDAVAIYLHFSVKYRDFVGQSRSGVVVVFPSEEPSYSILSTSVTFNIALLRSEPTTWQAVRQFNQSVGPTAGELSVNLISLPSSEAANGSLWSTVTIGPLSLNVNNDCSLLRASSDRFELSPPDVSEISF